MSNQPTIQENVDNFNLNLEPIDFSAVDLDFSNGQIDDTNDQLSFDKNTFKPNDNGDSGSILKDSDVTGGHLGSNMGSHSSSITEDLTFFDISSTNNEFSRPLVDSTQSDSMLEVNGPIFGDDPISESSLFVDASNNNDEINDPTFIGDSTLDVPEYDSDLSVSLTNTESIGNRFSLTDSSGTFESDIHLSIIPSLQQNENSIKGKKVFDELQSDFDATKDGSDMLLYQGIIAFEYFTEHAFSFDEIKTHMSRAFTL